jgi:hypothetical protein
MIKSEHWVSVDTSAGQFTGVRIETTEESSRVSIHFQTNAQDRYFTLNTRLSDEPTHAELESLAADLQAYIANAVEITQLTFPEWLAQYAPQKQYSPAQIEYFWGKRKGRFMTISNALKIGLLHRANGRLNVVDIYEIKLGSA